MNQPRERRQRGWSPRATAGFAAILAALALAVGGGARAAPPADTAATEANITRVVTSVLAESQFAHHPLDDQLAAKLLDRYLEALDGDRSLFLQSDVDGFAGYRATLSRASVAGDSAPAHAIFARYLERLAQRVAYEAELLKAGGFEFTGHDTFAFDRDRAARPKDLDAARKLWKEALRAEFLQEKLGDAAPKPAEIAKTLARRHEQRLKAMRGLGRDEVLALYLDSLSHVYDPHSDYLGHEEMESFSIEMNLSLFGIGAALGNDDGACTIRELVPGSPAEKSGLLKPGDRIIAVAQGSGDPVDVTDMPLSKIVGLIRGPKGSIVTLTVLPPAGSAGPPLQVKIERAEIKLEDQQARARVIELPEAGGRPARLGVVELPSFYSGERGGKGAAADVALLLGKLKAEGVGGVILDLRKNGGGSLDEAIKLAGLFIKSGPVVQTRDARNSVQVDPDPDPGVAYDGPLVVLTSRFSASASEIVAGALQDYGRAVVVGDETTFGKGTVQTIMPLGKLMDRAKLEHAYDPGAVKVTIAKFYRPSGASTELRGVASDIVVPSRSEVAPVGESKLKDPLPWDTIAAARFDRQNRVAPYLAALRARSKARIDADPVFSDLRKENAAAKARLASGALVLNEAERRQELATAKARDQAIESATRKTAAARKSYLVTVKDVGVPGLGVPETLPPPTASGAGGASGAG
ncbi:MAG TPA: carboxy terminal-processing peptidase, partial [Polyangia bacterium]|nr:carboxy terminal-processing peptidase [Polyangia bacterium]